MRGNVFLINLKSTYFQNESKKCFIMFMKVKPQIFFGYIPKCGPNVAKV